MTEHKLIEADGALAGEIRFLKRALGRDGLHPTMGMVLVAASAADPRERMGVATDGRVMHIVDPLSCGGRGDLLTPGLWKILRAKRRAGHEWIVLTGTDAEQFPPWERIPEAAAGAPAAFESSFRGVPGDDLKEGHEEFVDLLREFPDPTALRLGHLCGLGRGAWRVAWRGAGLPVWFEDGNRKAAVMPVPLAGSGAGHPPGE